MTPSLDDVTELTNDPAGRSSPSPSPSPSATTPASLLLWRLYLSHTLSTWNSRTFEFGAVIFLAAAFPGTLFFASCYALFRSAAAAILGSWTGTLVDKENRLFIVRQSIVWQRLSVAASCLSLFALVSGNGSRNAITYGLFVISVVLACFEKLAFIANTVAVERDWIIVISDSLKVDRQELNSAMRRIDLVCKLIAPVGIGLLDGYSTKLAICAVFTQNAISVAIESFAIAHVYAAIPALAAAKQQPQTPTPPPPHHHTPATPRTRILTTLASHLHPWKSYAQNPAFLASFSLSLLSLTRPLLRLPNDNLPPHTGLHKHTRLPHAPLVRDDDALVSPEGLWRACVCVGGRGGGERGVFCGLCEARERAFGACGAVLEGVEECGEGEGEGV